jgi:O-antigen/teichoic acid export membrane protein
MEGQEMLNKHSWLISLSTFFLMVLMNLIAILTFSRIPFGVGLLMVSVLNLALYVFMVSRIKRQKRRWHHALFVAVLSVATISVILGVACGLKLCVLYSFIVSLCFGRRLK